MVFESEKAVPAARENGLRRGDQLARRITAANSNAPHQKQGFAAFSGPTARAAWRCAWLNVREWLGNRLELLLIGKRGHIPAPAPGTQLESVIEAPVGRHSEKPIVFRKMIEPMSPSLPKLEMFARGVDRDGWTFWGNEAEDA